MKLTKDNYKEIINDMVKNVDKLNSAHWSELDKYYYHSSELSGWEL